MSTRFIVVPIVLVLIFFADEVAAQCRTDTECKGDRICENGICVVPQAVVANTEAVESYEAPESYVETESGNVIPTVVTVPAEPLPRATPVLRPKEPIAVVPPSFAPGRTVRIDLNLSLLNFTRTKWNFDSDEGYSVSNFRFGPVPMSRIGFGIGFSSNGHAFFGARVILGISTQKWKEAGDSSDDDDEKYLKLDYALLPYFEYTFGTGRVKPFLSLQVGLDGTYERAKWEELGGDYSSTWINATNMGVIGLGGGVHIFLASAISLDLWLLESIGVGSLIESDNWESDGQSETHDDKTFVWSSRTELFLGLSGWI